MDDHPAPANFVDLTDTACQKMSLLTSLVQLEYSRIGTQCAQCINDPTVDAQQRVLEWVPGVKKDRHDITFHSVYPRANRWVKSFVRDDEFTDKLMN